MWRRSEKPAFFFALAAGLVAATLAFASDSALPPHPVEVPWGAWFAGALEGVKAGAASLIAFAVGQWGPPYVKSALSDAVIKRAVDFAFAQIEGAARGKVLTVQLSNAVAARALGYVVTQEPMVAQWLGAQIGPLVLARLSELCALPQDAISPPQLSPALLEA